MISMLVALCASGEPTRLKSAVQPDGVDAVTAVDIPGGIVINDNDVVAAAGKDRIGATPGIDDRSRAPARRRRPVLSSHRREKIVDHVRTGVDSVMKAPAGMS